MPHVVDVRCPDCTGPATFEFAEVARIRLRQDVPFFKKHPLFEHALVDSRNAEGRWHAAIFFPGLHVRDTSALRDLPDGYSPSDWDHSKYSYRTHGLDVGTVVCSKCPLRRRHTLRWPEDARFQLGYRGQTLWAFNRDSAVALREFVASDDRKATKWASFLLHVPKEFLAAKARSEVVKQLDRILSPT